MPDDGDKSLVLGTCLVDCLTLLFYQSNWLLKDVFVAQGQQPECWSSECQKNQQ